MASIEEENTSLEGVMTAVHFGNKEVLSDAVLQRLLNHFNKYSLKNKDLYTPDLLGDAYEYLIKMFADDAGKEGWRVLHTQRCCPFDCPVDKA